MKIKLSLLVAFQLGLSVLVAATPARPFAQATSDLPVDPAAHFGTLPNGVRYVIYPNKEPRGRASLRLLVEAGSLMENEDQRGVAHFLEHMLFLGTDKYPDPAEYEEYITEHGGTRNAFTSFENTNYFFDVNAAYLPEALDRFAQFFIAPRFDADYVEREKNAVEAEYQMGLKSDPRRGLDVLQAVMNPAHPYSPG